MRIAVTFTPPDSTPTEQHWLWRSAGRSPEADFRDESDFALQEETDLIVHALVSAGHEPLPHPVESAPELCRFLERENPELIFNCCEALGGDSAFEMKVAALFELYGISYTGSPPETLALARNKGVAKAVLDARGVQTPRYAVVEELRQLEDLTRHGFPLIVKPSCEDASIGVDIHALVRDRASLVKRVQFVLQEFRQPALVEEFIEGRELTVSVLAGESGQLAPLPVAEVLFDGIPKGAPRILGYEEKWVRDSPFYGATPAQCPASLDPGLETRVCELALRAARALGVRDYGRVDLRLRDQDGALHVIDVNPNPHLHDDNGFLRAARASGRTDEGTVLEIVQRAMERRGASPPTEIAGEALPTSRR